VLAADADAEDHAAPRDIVERGELARHERRRAERQEQDAGAELDPLGDRCERRERDSDVEQRMVEGDVVARPEESEAGRLGCRRDLREVLRVRHAPDERAAPLHSERRQTRQARS
jgi:hypothetical protein